MTAHSPLSRRASDDLARRPDRAGFRSEVARPVPCVASDPAEAGHFQSDADFATPVWLFATVAANRRTDRICAGVMLVIAGLAALSVGLPALCMWVAGGTPA